MRQFVVLVTASLFALSSLSCRAQLLEARLAGRIVDADGNGCVARVAAYEVKVVNGSKVLLARCNTTSTKDGQYGCPRLPAGKFIIAASLSKGTYHGSTTPYFFPGVTDIGDTEPVVLTAGLDSWAEIHAFPLVGVSLSGKLYPSAQEAAFTLRATSEGLTIDSQATVVYNGKTGSFKMDGVLPGHYMLEASWLVQEAEHRAAVPVTVLDRPITGLRLDALANVTVFGTIASNELANVAYLNMSRVDGMIPELAAPIENGAFSFPAVPAGEYIVTSPDQSVFVGSVLTNGKVLNGSIFTTGIAPTQAIQVNFAGPALRLSGRVSFWNSADSKADVVAVSENSGTIHHAVTDANRHFVISGLPPGSYMVFAWPGPDRVAYRLKSILAKDKEHSVEVSLSPSYLGEDIEITPIDGSR